MSRAKQTLASLLAIAAWSLASRALAHAPSDSFLELTPGPSSIGAQWKIDLRDVADLLDVDANQDGQITWGELRRQSANLGRTALARLKVTATTGEPCTPAAPELLVEDLSRGMYAVLSFELQCPDSTVDKLIVTYDFLFDRDAQHRAFLKVRSNEQPAADESAVVVFTPKQRIATIPLGEPTSWHARFVTMVREGVWHIAIGFDHILFLVTLLIPAVLTRTHGRWQPQGSFRGSLIDTIKVVTAFTIAHSITLGLTIFEWVSLPPRVVESIIAFSIVVAAGFNLTGWGHHRRWQIATGFGLIHGFGFASVLGDLGLSGSSRALSLVSFNLGVELGQLAIVATLLPLLYAWRRNSSYLPIALAGGSAAAGLLAAAWMVERSMEIELLPF